LANYQHSGETRLIYFNNDNLKLVVTFPIQQLAMKNLLFELKCSYS